VASGWTVDAAADLFHGLVLPATWRELTAEVGWPADEYQRHLARLLRRALIEE
jgi:hypothetical protein